MRLASTRDSHLSSAQLCRERGWTAGTLIEGDEGYGMTVIRITAVGERDILAVAVSHKGVAYPDPLETTWILQCRDWRTVER